jgi:formylmethanofuran dehydrogenase subunit B
MVYKVCIGFDFIIIMMGILCSKSKKDNADVQSRAIEKVNASSNVILD